jgi:hypothetical protein
MQLGGKIIMTFLVLIVLSSLLTLLGSILFFLFQRKPMSTTWQENRLTVNPIIQPLMGFVRVHLMHQKEVCSESILLLPEEKAGIVFLKGPMASAPLKAGDAIKVETIDGMLVHFEDPFRFFSISFFKAVSLERLRLPDAPAENTDWLYSKHPDREEEHTANRQRKAGDWLHLKSFEPGDDVRRIVWTLYARHKSLMVRWQDQQDPHGDTLKAFVSFNATNTIKLDADLLAYTETQYKQRLFALLSGFLQEGVLLDWRTNNKPWVKGISSDDLANELTRASWHFNSVQETDLTFPSLVFVSSVDTLDYVEYLAAIWPDALFVQVDLLQSLANRSWYSRIKGLFFKPRSNKYSSLFDVWWRHPRKAQLLKNENQIKKIIQLSTKEGGFYV